MRSFSTLSALLVIVFLLFLYRTSRRQLDEDLNEALIKLNELEADLSQEWMLVQLLIVSNQIQLNTTESSENIAEIEDTLIPIIPILVLACNRITVAKCLDSLLAHRPNPHQFPIIVSQGCDHAATRNVIRSYGENVTLVGPPTDRMSPKMPPQARKLSGYYKIADHYSWALNETFDRGYDLAIIVEDDMIVAPDFYELFLGTHRVLQMDESLMCVSAWNDNGKAGTIDEQAADLLYRTDFFPGLGWMLTKELWTELAVKWPVAFWDDWLREPQQRKDRACIRPEISRTTTFGKAGVSNGLFYDKHLRYVKLNNDFVEFSKMDLMELMQDEYDEMFLGDVQDSAVIGIDEIRGGNITVEGDVRLVYKTLNEFKEAVKLLNLMDDLKSGIPRTAYHGILTGLFRERRVYLTPAGNWSGYNELWK